MPAHLQHLIPDDQQRVARILAFEPGRRALDVGCSDGAITRRIEAAHGVCLIGVDKHAHGEYLPWDCRKSWPYLPWHLEFDTIYACEVFEHLTDADNKLALANILAILKPGGDLIVTVPNRRPNDVYEVGCRSRWAWPDHRSAWWASKLWHWLAPHFESLHPVPLYDGERWTESIWLIMRAAGKR